MCQHVIRTKKKCRHLPLCQNLKEISGILGIFYLVVRKNKRIAYINIHKGS